MASEAPASSVSEDPAPIESEDPGNQPALTGRAADRAAVALVVSSVLVGGVVLAATIVMLNTSLMRGAPAIGFELAGRSRSYSEALAASWPAFASVILAVLIGCASAALAIPILRWIDRVPSARSGVRWAIVIYPLLVTMPVRVAGPASLIGEGHYFPETLLSVGLVVHLTWLSAGIPVATIVAGFGRRWTSQRAALLLSIAVVTSWVAVDIAAPMITSQVVAFASLGPVIDTALSLAGALPLAAALATMATMLLTLPTVVLAVLVFRPDRPPEPGRTDRPFGPAWAAALTLAMVAAWAPLVLTAVMAISRGAVPWEICGPPTGCAPWKNTSLLFLPTALAAAVVAGAGYYAGWLNPANRTPLLTLSILIALLLPPTVLGTSLWLTTHTLGIGTGLTTMWIGQSLLAIGVAYCAIRYGLLGAPPYDPDTDEPRGLPPGLVRAAIYAGIMGAIFASGDFAVAQQLSGDVQTIPTAAFADAVNTGWAAGDSLIGLMWTLVTVPIFIFCLAQLRKLHTSQSQAE